jgi:hypothetical protein
MNTPVFKTIEGRKSILLSAPHVYAHRRPRLSMSYKLGEPLTDTIVEDVCKNINSWGIVLKNESNFDANYHKEESNPYKQEVKLIVKKHKIKYFLDIHGLKDGHMYDIAIYYPTQFRKSIELARNVRSGLDKGKLKGVSIAIFRFLDNHEETLGEYCANNLRVPSIQIEISRYIRENQKLRDEFVNNLSTVLDKQVI